MASKNKESGEESAEEIMDEDTTDSLDIKPPQAQRAEKRHKLKKSSKEKRHSGKHKHRSHDRYEKTQNDKYRDDQQSRRYESSRYVDYFQHPARPGRDQQARYQKNYYDDRENYGNRYRKQNDTRKRYEREERQRSPQHTSRERQHQSAMSEADRMADEMLQDLRSKLLMKKNKLDEEAKAEKRVGHSSITISHKEKKTKSKRNTEDIVEIQESKPSLTVKEKEDEELVARRARLLEADRQMARRKEKAREELEARREIRRVQMSDDSPPAINNKKRKTEKNISKQTQEIPDDDIVMVSDHSDDNDSDSDSRSSVTSGDVNDESNNDESDLDLPTHSPISLDEISKPEWHKKRMSSRSASHSDHKRSQSRSPHSKSRSPEESLSLTSDDRHSRSGSRSDSQDRRSYRNERSTRSRSSHCSDSDEEDRSSKTPEDVHLKTLPKKDPPEIEDNEKPEENVDSSLPQYFPAIQGCRSVEEFQCLNRIEEGTYGVVYRAKDKRTDEIVALKRLKMEKEKEGFPITSLREINTLLKGQHPNIVTLPAVQKMTFTDYPVSNLRKKFCKHTSELGLSLLQGLLTYDPKQRLTAEAALKSTFFKELPLPIDPAMFPTWPAKSELGLKKALASSPKPPSGGGEFKRLGDDVNEPAGFHLSGVTYAESRQFQMGPGFSLKF
uniref:cyclin-dependent kinase n=1 Tax=Culicoides sonorensis TaxID=179676 RepID=A0A336LT46_CULSO